MTGRLTVALTLGLASLLALSSALAQDHDTAHATIEVTGASGGRTEADVTHVMTRLRTALARCGDAGREAPGAETRVSLAITSSGRITATPVGDSQFVAFQSCVVSALARVRLAAGEEGTAELHVGWHEPRGYGTAMLGGFHSRSSSLPTHPRTERVAVPYPDAQVTTVAQEHDVEVHHCFASELAHRPDVSGTIRLRFTIGLDGTVSAAAVDSDDVHVPAVNECLIARVTTWTFPPPTTGEPAVVTHAFALR